MNCVEFELSLLDFTWCSACLPASFHQYSFHFVHSHFFLKKSCFWFLISFSIPSLLFTFLSLSPLFSSFFRNETEKLRNVLSHIFFSLKKEKIFSLCFKETLQLLQRHCKNKKNYTLSALCFNIFLSPLCIFFLHNSNHPFLQYSCVIIVNVFYMHFYMIL